MSALTSKSWGRSCSTFATSSINAPMLFGVIFELPFDRVAEALIEMVGNATFFRAHRHVPLLLRRSAFVNGARVRPRCARGARLSHVALRRDA